jgi:hypothetical protein
MNTLSLTKEGEGGSLNKILLQYFHVIGVCAIISEKILLGGDLEH